MDWFKLQFSTGYRAPNNQIDVSPAQSALIVSILSAGTFCGALSAAPFADHIGRRKSLILSVCVFTIGVIMQLCSLAIPLLVVGRYVLPSGALVFLTTADGLLGLSLDSAWA
jgi:predicted MFS family arabinose efflux permease